MKTETAHFRVEADFIVNLARRLAWMDEERGKGISLLGTLVDPGDPTRGLSYHCVERVLDGFATLEGDSDKGVTYVERVDKEWRKTVAERALYFRRRDERKKKAAKQRLDIERAVDGLPPRDAGELAIRMEQRCISAADLLDRSQRSADAILNEDASPLAAVQGFTRRAIAATDWTGWKGETESFGLYTVPEPLWKRYRYVVKTIRQGAFLGVGRAFQNDPLAFLQLEEERVALHDAICKVLGVERKTEAETSMTTALYARLATEIGTLGEK